MRGIAAELEAAIPMTHDNLLRHPLLRVPDFVICAPRSEGFEKKKEPGDAKLSQLILH
jgi:hypothetical protein